MQTFLTYGYWFDVFIFGMGWVFLLWLCNPVPRVYKPLNDAPSKNDNIIDEGEI